MVLSGSNPRCARYVRNDNKLLFRAGSTVNLPLLTATTEIKSWVLALSRRGRFKLDGDRYEIIDPYNITSVPPIGRFRIERI